MKRIRSANVAVALLIVVLLAGGVAGVLAQRNGGPGGPGGPAPLAGQGMPGAPGPGFAPPMSPAPLIEFKAGPDGVFFLQGGTLLKYNPSTLEVAGSLELVAKPQPPAVDNGNALPPMPPPVPGGQMLLAGGKVLVVIADKFVAVNAATMQIAAESTLPEPQKPQAKAGTQAGPPPAGPRPGGPGPGGPGCQMQLAGDVLYVVRGDQILAINVSDGSLVAKGSLPKPPVPENR